MKNALKYSGVALALAATPFTLQAAQGQAATRGFNYNYIQAQYDIIDIANDDGDGLRVIGSFDLNKDVFLRASLATGSFDSGVDTTELTIGAGYHAPIDSRTDMVFTGSIVNYEVDAPAGSNDDTGYMFTGGVRYSVQSDFELEGGMGYINIFDNTDIGFYAGAVYDINRSMSLTVNYSTIGEDTDILAVGVRFAM